MTQDKYWLVMLKSEDAELEQLMDELKAPPHCIVKEEGAFYLKSTGFNALVTANEVYAEARRLIHRLNFLLSKYFDSFKPIEIGSVSENLSDSKRVETVFIEARGYSNSLAATHHGTGSVTLFDSNGQPVPLQPIEPPPPPTPEQIRKGREEKLGAPLALALDSENVYDAIRYFERGSWINLYKAFEVIRDDVGGQEKMPKLGLASSGKEISRFASTAQSRDAIGDEARHGNRGKNKLINPMSFEEATRFLKQMLDKWIGIKKSQT